jgi:type VI secretion system FHA domain protein
MSGGGPPDVDPARTDPSEPAPQLPAAAAPKADSAVLDALFTALGFDPADLSPDRRRSIAQGIGATYPAMAEALRQLLIGRDTVKRELGIARTAVQFGSNPLKFTLTQQAAIEALLDPKLDGYLTGEDAVVDALESMQAHQLALVGAIRAAVRTALDAFDPDALEAKIEKGGLSQVVPALRRAELWERFRDEYARFADQADQDIRMVIGRELDKLYAQEAAAAPAPGRRSSPGQRAGPGGETP